MKVSDLERSGSAGSGNNYTNRDFTGVIGQEPGFFPGFLLHSPFFVLFSLHLFLSSGRSCETTTELTNTVRLNLAGSRASPKQEELASGTVGIGDS